MIQRFKQYANEQRYEALYAWRRRRFRSGLPAMRPQDQLIIDELKRHGGYGTTVEALAIPETSAMLAAADALFTEIAGRSPAAGDFGVQPSAAEIERYPALIKWGLDPRLLAIVTRYIGLPVVYRGLTVRRDIAGGEKKDTRLFHRDNEDNRIIKIVVYLNDIDEDGGPFEFIPLSLAPSSWRVALNGSRVDDTAIAAFVPAEQWRTCTGRRGTALFVDTCRIFHRGRVGRTVDRRALFFCYNSCQPMSPQWCAPLFDHVRFLKVHTELTPSQRAAIDTPYGSRF